MNQQKNITTGIFVFSKWSRKAYAIFASLGKLIKIGVLKTDICKKALLKGLVKLGNIVGIKEDPHEDETALNITELDSLQLMLSFLGILVSPTINLTSDLILKKVPFFKIILFRKEKACFLLNVRNRLFLLTQAEFYKSLNNNYSLINKLFL